MPRSRTITYQMERLLGPSSITTRHGVRYKPCGNEDDFIGGFYRPQAQGNQIY